MSHKDRTVYKSSSNNLLIEQTNTAAKDTMTGLKIRVRGLVQGVGFRPTVWRFANDCCLSGEVHNDSQGVLIMAWGDADDLHRFKHLLIDNAPPLARIDSINCTVLFDAPLSHEFHIAKSQRSTMHTAVVPDAATCDACIAEISDVGNRRHNYAFTNCTHCGPRLSIINDTPYDRSNTSMAKFSLCSDCQKEYDNPVDRRFHAQPNACAVCGPKLQLQSSKLITPLLADEAITAACDLLSQGEIIAIKGLGGFHLACDAINDKAVAHLRKRKHRFCKPFALMARDINVIRRYCSVNEKEKSLLGSSAAPIAILLTQGSEKVSVEVAPGQNSLGFMLPYTPLHHLLLHKLMRPIVLTSGNISDEPQCVENEQAKEKLASLTDYFLLHNRDIVNRIDDSVVRVMGGKARILRRARGYAPAPIVLPQGFEQTPPLLAMGGELKNTFCLLKDGQAILSQHMGDLENAQTFLDYQKNLKLYRQLYQHDPEVLAIDKHPEYLSSKLGRDLSKDRKLKDDIPIHEVQHHHAHIASCMAENNLPLSSKPVLGVALDGLGFGSDETLWGGEFLLADYYGFERLAAFKPVAMLGGVKAMLQPWRNTYAQIVSSMNWQAYLTEHSTLELTQFLQTKPLRTLESMLAKNLHSPLSSSCGRLFDAVAAAVGICREHASYEGQAAIELEAIVETKQLNNVEAYPFSIHDNTNINGNYSPKLWLDPAPMWQALLLDLENKVPSAEIAAKFHLGLAQAISGIILRLCVCDGQRMFNTVALSGGVFQNRILLEQVLECLQMHDFEVLTHHLLPSNDGGLSFGQAVIAAARAMQA